MHIMSFLYGFMLLHDRKDISFQDCLPSTVTIYIKYFLLNPDLKSGVKPAHLKEKHFRKIPFANTPASTEAVLDVNKLSFHFKKAGRV